MNQMSWRAFYDYQGNKNIQIIQLVTINEEEMIVAINNKEEGESTKKKDKAKVKIWLFNKKSIAVTVISFACCPTLKLSTYY